MEIVISRRLKQHLGICNIFTSEQYGFSDAVSTSNAIYKLYNINQQNAHFLNQYFNF
jgi:hypothetical protein